MKQSNELHDILFSDFSNKLKNIRLDIENKRNINLPHNQAEIRITQTVMAIESGLVDTKDGEVKPKQNIIYRLENKQGTNLPNLFIYLNHLYSLGYDLNWLFIPDNNLKKMHSHNITTSSSNIRIKKNLLAQLEKLEKEILKL